MNQFKIPKSTANRKRYKQSIAVELQMAVDCPSCNASAGYYCTTSSDKKTVKYHLKRFEAYITKGRKSL